MATDHKIIRASEDFKGLDKRSSDIARTIQYATDIRNAAFRVSGAINKRKGFQHFDLDETANSYCAGMVTYNDVNKTDGSVTETLIRALYTADSTTGNNRMYIQKLFPAASFIRITVTAATLAAYNVFYSKILDETTLTFKIIIKRISKTTGVEEELLNVDVGTGKEGASDPNLYTLSDLQTAIQALYSSYGISSNFVSSSNPSAALLTGAFFGGAPPIKTTEIELTNTATDIVKDEWVTVNSGDSANIADLLAFDDVDIHSDGELENVSFAQLNNVLYISNGHGPVVKYDGNKVYRAGLPGIVDDVIPGTWAYDEQNVITVETSTSGATIPQGTYHYKFVILYTDYKGNTITSQPSDPISITHSANSHIDIGWDLSIFDYLDKDASKLKMCVYRTVKNAAATDLYYKLDTNIPYNNDEGHTLSTGEPVRFQDTTVLLNNQAAYSILPEPIKRHDPPPKGKYLSVYKNCLVISGQKQNVNNVQYSLPKNAVTGEIGSEYFPDDDNGIIIQSSFGDKITAIAPLRDLLYVFHKNSIHVISGNINELEVPTTDLITKEGGVGCQSYHSIEEFNNSLVFLSQNGIYSIDSSSALSEVSSLIKPLFLDNELKRKRAVSFNWTEKNILLFIIPKETLVSGGGSAEYINNLSTSLVLAYDYFKDAWLQWDSLDFSAGISLYDNLVHFAGRGAQNFTSYFLDNGDKYDYRNHNESINFNYETNWESLQEPTIPKKYLRLKIHSFDTDQQFESPEGFDLNVKIQKNYIPVDLGTINFDFGKVSGGGWGNFQWGSGTWGSISTDSVKSKLPTGKSKCIKFRFTNEDINENVLITTYEMEIAAPFLTEIKE